MCEQNGDFVLHGVVSRGKRCGSDYYPGIYANVAKHVEYILGVVKYVSSIS